MKMLMALVLLIVPLFDTEAQKKGFEKVFIADSSYMELDPTDFETVDTIADGRLLVKSYRMDSSLKSSYTFSDGKKNVLEGEMNLYHPGERLKCRANYKNNKFDGILETYYPNGKIKRHDIYKEGKLVKGECFNLNGFPIKYYDYQIQPNVDLDLVYSNLVYPEMMRRTGREANLLLKLYVDETGKIIRIYYSEDSPTEFISEAIKKLLQFGKITPEIIDGEAQSCRLLLPFEFHLK